MKRRDFLRSALAVSAAAPLSPVFAPASFTPAPHLRFPTEARQRLSVTSYPFRTLIDSPTNSGRDRSKPGMDLKAFAAMVVERFGVHNINPLADHLSSTEPAYLDAFRRAVEAAGSHLTDLGLGGREFASPATAARDEAVAFGSRGIDLAVALGSPSVRQHLKAPPGAAPSVEYAAESLGRLAAYGARKNVVVNLENDSPGAEDPFFLVKVLAKVDHPHLRALPDFGNSIRGHDAAFNRDAVAAMFAWAFNICHVKDALGSKDGHIDRLDVPEMFAVARASSFHGYFSMEFDTAVGDPFQGTQHLIEQSLEALG